MNTTLMRFAPLLLIACNHAPVEKTASTTPASSTASPIVATVNGQPVTMAELDVAAAGELYEARKNALESLVTDRAIEPLAKKANQTPEEYLHALVEAKVPQVGPIEAKSFFEANKERLPPQLADKNFDEVKDDIIKGLTAQQRQQAIGQIISDLRDKAQVKILLIPPKVDVAAVGPARGAANAKITIVEFSDFQCPYCAKGREVMDKVLKVYDGKVRVVFRDFPLPFHEHAQKAAEAAQCANEQGKFWELHDWMFDHQAALSVPELEQEAKGLGLDGVKFGQCLTSGKYEKAIAENIKEGQKAGVKGTPAFFVNGAFLNGALPFEEFQKTIDAELARNP